MLKQLGDCLTQVTRAFGGTERNGTENDDATEASNGIRGGDFAPTDNRPEILRIERESTRGMNQTEHGNEEKSSRQCTGNVNYVTVRRPCAKGLTWIGSERDGPEPEVIDTDMNTAGGSGWGSTSHKRKGSEFSTSQDKKRKQCMGNEMEELIARVNMPQIEIPVFYGESDVEFRDFLNKFTRYIAFAKVSDEHKLQVLLQACKSTSPCALDLTLCQMRSSRGLPESNGVTEGEVR